MWMGVRFAVLMIMVRRKSQRPQRGYSSRSPSGIVKTMSRSADPASDRDLLRRISRSAGSKAGYKQLVRELGLGGGRERRLLVEQLTRMVARGDLIAPEGGLWALPPRPVETVKPPSPTSSASGIAPAGRDHLVSGRFDLHRDGFGFVRADPGGAQAARSEDIFIPPNEVNGAMHGDVVLVDEAPPARDGRRSGRIARVLTRRHPTVVGIFHSAQSQARRHSASPVFTSGFTRSDHVVPMDERLGSVIEVREGTEQALQTASSPHRTLGEPSRQPRHANSQARSEGQDSGRSLDGMAVEVELLSFPSPGHPARGLVIEVLGRPDDFGVDVEIVIRKHHLPHTFPPATLAEAEERAGFTVLSGGEQELARREDFRGLPIVTIDGETARDFDDAVLVRPLDNGHTELQVHIADVSSYVLAGSALDTEARVRGTSVYFPDRAVPMLPHALSSGMCSLLPHEDRFALSCVMQIDDRGEVAGYRLAEGVIRSVRRCTYTSVQSCLNASPAAEVWNGKQSPLRPAPGEGAGRSTKESSGRKPITPEANAEDLTERERVALEQPEVPAAFDSMLELALKLNRKRVRRGSIDFDLPEPVVEFDPDGNMKAIVRSERGWAHRLIEEFMLSANECVAHWLEGQAIPSLYRIHEMPDPKRIVEFEEMAAGFGQSLGLGTLPVKRLTMKSDRRESLRRSTRGQDARAPQSHEIPERIPVTPQMYQRLVSRIAGKPEERVLAYLMLRSLKQARYAEKNEGHFALASPSYTHFTSPIRRYPDLIVHRLVRAMLRGGVNPEGTAIRRQESATWNQGSEPKAVPPSPVAAPLASEELKDIAVESSQAERRAAEAERELIEWKKMKFMADKVGDDFRAMILSVTKYGFFVELDELFIEGLVPLGSLVGDLYSFRDTDRSICGARTGHCFQVGQRVEVILDRIDRQQRRLQFALLPETEPAANTGRVHGFIPAVKTKVKKGKGLKKKAGKHSKHRLRKAK